MNIHGVKRVGLSVGMLAVVFAGILSVPDNTSAAERVIPPAPAVPKPAPQVVPESTVKTGLQLIKEGVSDGYVIIATKEHPSVYLIDPNGRVVHEWNPQRQTSQAVHLLPNGNLLRTARSLDGKVGDVIEEMTWDGELIWEYTTDRTMNRIHHNVEKLPNGNVLVSVWEKKTRQEFMAVGRNPETVSGSILWVDAIYEVKPTGTSSGEVVWRWSPWDRLIQNFDPKAENFGNPTEHPTLVDVNQTRKSDEFARFADWLHVNSITYNAERDEILFSVHSLSEMWVISRKTDEIVYRWGNPSRYGKGGAEDQVLFHPHNPHWIFDGRPGEGNILIFNNDVGEGRGEGEYSSVLEVRPPLTESGEWPAPTKDGFPACDIVWEYTGSSESRIYSKALSNAQRQKNGNTLICMGTKGSIIEINGEEDVVWSYINPVFKKSKPMKSLEKWHNRPLPAGNMMFRAYKYSPDFPAFAGRNLAPKQLLEEVVDENQKPKGAQ